MVLGREVVGTLMKSVIELEIDVPQARLAALFADPQQNTKWMDDVERVETISGQLGMPGSTYRLVPKKGKMVFVATVLARNLPSESRLSLEASNVTVSVKGFFVALSSNRTRLTSEEVFSFKGHSVKYLASLRREQLGVRTAAIWRHSSASWKPIGEHRATPPNPSSKRTAYGASAQLKR
jgi:hypothetical protein